MSTAPSLPQGRQRRRGPWQVQRAVLFAVVLREMRLRVGGQWLSALWTVFEPLAHVLVLIIVTAGIRGMTRPGVEYPVFLVAGLVPFFFFQKTVTRMLDGIDGNRGLFAYRQVKPIDALLGRAFVEGLMNLVVYVVTLALLGWIGYHAWPGSLLELIGVNLAIGLLGASSGLLFAVLSHERPRLRSVIRLSFMPLYLVSGVIFNVDNLPREVIDVLLWNPLLHLVELSRSAFIRAYVPTQGIGIGYPLMFTLVTTALALSLYRANRLRLLTLQ